jgi:hypothetical protein
MKLTSLLAFIAVVVAGPAYAFDVPNSVHRADELEKAIAEATKSKRGIVYVASDSSLKPS